MELNACALLEELRQMALSSWSHKPPESNISVHAVHRNARNGISEDVEGTGHPARVTITDAALSPAWHRACTRADRRH